VELADVFVQIATAKLTGGAHALGAVWEVCRRRLQETMKPPVPEWKQESTSKSRPLDLRGRIPSRLIKQAYAPPKDRRSFLADARIRYDERQRVLGNVYLDDILPAKEEHISVEKLRTEHWLVERWLEAIDSPPRPPPPRMHPFLPPSVFGVPSWQNMNTAPHSPRMSSTHMFYQGANSEVD